MVVRVVMVTLWRVEAAFVASQRGSLLLGAFVSGAKSA